MVPKIIGIQQVNLQRRDTQQNKCIPKKKTPDTFKDVLAATINKGTG